MQLCGSPPPIFDAGVPTGVCGALARCCMTLPATEQPSCQTIAASDDQMACNTTLQAEQRAGMCEPRPP